MASRTTLSELSSPPVSGAAVLAEYADRLKSLFDASSLPLTTVAGTADAVTAVLDPALDAGGLVDGMKFTLTWGAANTAGVTLSINGGTALSVLDAAGAALAPNALTAGLRSQIEYIGGSFRLIGGSGDDAANAPYFIAITATTTWNRPAGYADDALVVFEAWGAGGGGGRGTGTSNAGGGGGGGYARREMRYADVPSSIAITIGAPGVGRTGSTGDGTAGSATTIGTILTAYGGGGGEGNGSGGGRGGGGGGEVQVGSSSGVGGSIGGGNCVGSTAPDHTTPATDARSIWGGGAGGGGSSGEGGRAVYGGGGGGGGGNGVNGGTSKFGGGGGLGGDGSPSPTAGTAPGGGGGGGDNVNAANGARGEARIWIQ